MKTVDLFCGCGGMSLGFQNAGYDIKLSVDSWEKAIQVYSTNFNHPVEQIDLTNEAEAIERLKKIQPEIIVGGLPCQDFSNAGKRDETLGREDLTYNYANIVCAITPEYFVMENVERIKKAQLS